MWFDINVWIPEGEMTDQEKIDNPCFHVTEGYLKKLDYKTAFQESYRNASKEDQSKVLHLPNFDADIFLEISGIDVRQDAQQENCDGKEVEIDGVKYKLVRQ